MTSTIGLRNIAPPCPGWQTAVGACEERDLEEQLTDMRDSCPILSSMNNAADLSPGIPGAAWHQVGALGVQGNTAVRNSWNIWVFQNL